METPQTQIVSIQPGDFLIKEKTHCDGLYIIKEGQLEVSKTGPNGEKVLVGIIGSGEYVGETALLLGRMNSSNVMALSPVQAIRLSKASIESQLKTVPPWLIALTRGLMDRLGAANEILRKNGWKDETLNEKVKAIEGKFKKPA
jgi:CRP-like cAMP-binding protein